MHKTPERSMGDVILFVTLLTAHIWIVIPLESRGFLTNNLLPFAAIAVAVVSLRRHGFTARSIGIRLDNLGPALGVYGGIALGYAAVTIAMFSAVFELGTPGFELSAAVGLYFWALAQEFLLLAYLLQRLTQSIESRFWAAGAAATLFAFFHWPNPFLTIYTFIGGWMLATLYRRWPNLLAAAAGHAAASSLVSQTLPGTLTGWMKVGPGYLAKIFL